MVSELACSLANTWRKITTKITTMMRMSKIKLRIMLNIENELASALGSRMRCNKVGIASMRAKMSRLR
jgi:hypothetical protein